MTNDQRDEREMRERRRRVVTRTVYIVIAAAMLISVVVPAIYAVFDALSHTAAGAFSCVERLVRGRKGREDNGVPAKSVCKPSGLGVNPKHVHRQFLQNKRKVNHNGRI